MDDSQTTACALCGGVDECLKHTPHGTCQVDHNLWVMCELMEKEDQTDAE